MQFGTTKFKNGIVADFGFKRKSSKIVILLDGLPTTSSKRSMIEAFASKGFFVIHPRFRGTWGSEGMLFDEPPVKDVLDVIDTLSSGFEGYWSKKKFSIQPKEIYVIGASFGGMVAIQSVLDERVTKAVAFSPVVEWSADTREVPLKKLFNYLHVIFKHVYRISKPGWQRALKSVWYNPIQIAKQIPKEKLLIIYSRDDNSIPFESMNSFVKENGCKSILLNKGGHLSSSLYTKNPSIKKAIDKFLRLHT